MVEFVLVLPLMLLLAFAGADLGRSIHEYIALGNAVRTAAEYASLHPMPEVDPTGWEARVGEIALEELSSTNSIDPTTVVIAVEVKLDADEMDVITVTGNLLFETVVKWPVLPTEMMLSHQVTMRCQR